MCAPDDCDGGGGTTAAACSAGVCDGADGATGAATLASTTALLAMVATGAGIVAFNSAPRFRLVRRYKRHATPTNAPSATGAIHATFRFTKPAPLGTRRRTLAAIGCRVC